MLMIGSAHFQLLRYKCEAFSTLGQKEEDLDLETRLQQNFLDHSSRAPPKLSAVAPAALYLTALLECVIYHLKRFFELLLTCLTTNLGMFQSEKPRCLTCCSPDSATFAFISQLGTSWPN